MLESEVDNYIYKGESSKPLSRFIAHNSGMNTCTRSRRPWKLIYVKELEDRSAALREEKRLKRCNRTYLLWLITQPGNIVNDPIALSRLA